MTGKVVKRVPLPHVCDPGWKWTPFPEGHVFAGMPAPAGCHGTPPSPSEYPKGTVWECSCGQFWVSRGAPRWPDIYRPGVCLWRRESRRERRRRLGLRWWQR